MWYDLNIANTNLTISDPGVVTLTSFMAALLTSDVLEMTCTYRHLAIQTGYNLVINIPGSSDNCIIKPSQGGVCHKAGGCNISTFEITKCEANPEQVTVQYTVPASHQWIYGSWTCGYGNPDVNDASQKIEQLGEHRIYVNVQQYS